MRAATLCCLCWPQPHCLQATDRPAARDPFDVAKADFAKVKILKSGSGKNYIGVGVISSSPLNVVNPVDGKVIWYTWQNMGAEARSVTDYCGIHLTDMVLVDTDNDGGDDIVFGTQFNWVCALDADNGATKWKITVGDAVTVMKVMDDPLTGQKRILVATEAGELYMLDRTGKKLNMITFGSEISDIEILTFPDKKRNDILLSTRDGRIIICDHNFLIRASFMVENVPLKGIVMGPEVGKTHQFFCASDKKVHFLQYRPYFKRMSRQF